MRKRLGACFLGLALLLSGPGGIAFLATLSPTSAEARTRGWSGGYTRPGIPAPRRPSLGELSPGDRAIARQQAEAALRNYRARQEPASPSPGPFGSIRIPRYGDGGERGWYAGNGWRRPPYLYGTPSHFGIWDALFLWFLLDTLTRPGHAQWFHDHQNDPGYQEWRAEADRLARSNAELRQRLDQLDRQLAQRQGQPQDPHYLPPDTPAEVAIAPRAQAQAAGRTPSSPSFGIGSSVLVAVVGGGILFLLWLARRHAAGTRPRASPFRLGMTLTLDPTPFVLAAGATKVPVPKAEGGNLLVSVTAIGTLGDGVSLHRLYLDERHFFQLHLDGSGAPDECRFFGRIDEVIPADESEWSFWLDPAQGMIGWPEFQTKDGKVYGRAWGAGSTRLPPHRFTERRQALGGSSERRIEAMLYAAPTGAAAPAPQSEYILLAMIEADGQAAIDIHAGIDVNPAALSLA